MFLDCIFMEKMLEKTSKIRKGGEEGMACRKEGG